MPNFSKDRRQKACGSLSASLQLAMTPWARQRRASKHTQSSLQDFLPGWCFNFQSVWVNNVWLSGPLLVLTISCLNPTVHRACGLGSVARVLAWAFLCLHNGASQYLVRISELWTKLIYQVLWTNENFQGCTEGSLEISDVFPSRYTLRLYPHLLPTGIQVRLNKKERKMVCSYNIFKLRCILNSIHTILREAWPVLSEQATDPAFCNRSMHFSGMTTTTERASWGLIPGGLWGGFFLFLLSVSLRKSKMRQLWKVQIDPRSMGPGLGIKFKTHFGAHGTTSSFPKGWLQWRKRTVKIPSSFLQDLN